MLFDLRGKGRRRTVRMIYTGLALLMGIGMVGFGVGSGFGGGGLFSAASSNEGGSSASFSAQIKKYSKLTRQQPGNVSAWESLTKAQLHEAGGEKYIDPSTGRITGNGRKLLKEASASWSSYLALNPPKPSPELALLMLNTYSEQGLNEPAKAVQALQIVIPTRPPSASLYGQLANYAYKSHNEREGDLAAEKAVSLAPAAQRKRVKEELAEVKKYPNGGGQTFTTTTNGKAYAVKRAPNGTFTGTQITKTPAPAKGATTTAKK